jgi:hypothetical protein
MNEKEHNPVIDCYSLYLSQSLGINPLEKVKKILLSFMPPFY